MQSNTCSNDNHGGDGRTQLQVADCRGEPPGASEATRPAVPGSPDYRALYFEAAGHRNSLLIEIKSLKSHIILLEQECHRLRTAGAQPTEALKCRQEKLHPRPDRHVA